MKYKTVISRSKVKTTQYIFKQKKIKISRLMSLLLHYSIQNYHQPNSFYAETYEIESPLWSFCFKGEYPTC